MEQVFDLVNVVLRRDRETRKRNLNIRAYKVIPLEVQAGIIEFVGNTSPLVSWLLKAHPKSVLSFFYVIITVTDGGLGITLRTSHEKNSTNKCMNCVRNTKGILPSIPG